MDEETFDQDQQKDLISISTARHSTRTPLHDFNIQIHVVTWTVRHKGLSCDRVRIWADDFECGTTDRKHALDQSFSSISRRPCTLCGRRFVIAVQRYVDYKRQSAARRQGANSSGRFRTPHVRPQVLGGRNFSVHISTTQHAPQAPSSALGPETYRLLAYIHGEDVDCRIPLSPERYIYFVHC